MPTGVIHDANTIYNLESTTPLVYEDHHSLGSIGTNPIPLDEGHEDDPSDLPVLNTLIPETADRDHIYSFHELVPSETKLPCRVFQDYARQYQEYLEKTQSALQLLSDQGVPDPEGMLQILRDTPFYCPRMASLKRKLRRPVEIFDTFEWQRLVIMLVAILGGIILLYRVAQKHCFND